MTSGDYKTAIVNSSTFGLYFPDLMERLENIGKVKRFTFPTNVLGEDLAKELNGYNFIIASVTPHFSADFFKNVDNLHLIARHGIGYDNVDIGAATQKGTLVTRVLGIHERNSVAELALSLMLICLRQVIPASQAGNPENWSKRKQFTGGELSGLKVGVIGYGNIGSRTAEILKDGFGARVSAYDPYIADAVIEKTGVKAAGFTEILSESDLLTFHASLNSGNYHFIGKKEFGLMKDGIVIVNTARGELIEEKALAEAAKIGKVAAAGLDVIEGEPIKTGNPLLGLENVYIVPHIGGYSLPSLRKMDEKMVEDIEKMVAGQKPDLIINPEIL